MSEQYLDYPIVFGPALARAGRDPQREGVAETRDQDKHLQALILSVLFTRPGERVMNPRFGAGLDRSVFENISPLASSALEYRIRDSLSLALESEIILEDVTITPDEVQGAMLIVIDYQRRIDRLPQRLEIVV